MQKILVLDILKYSICFKPKNILQFPILKISIVLFWILAIKVYFGRPVWEISFES